MDRKKSILNVSFSIIFKLFILVGNLLARRVLIATIGNEFNGLNSLFLSIIGFLSVAELGVGIAISFSMYKPIVEGDSQKVAALYNLFKKIYVVIGLIILLSGLCILPFLPFLISDYAGIDTNVYITFIIMLISIVLTYFYSAKISLINAYKNNYITTCITSGGLLVQYVLQIIVLFAFRSFEAYLLCRIVVSLLQWVATDIAAKILHKSIIESKAKVDESTKAEVTKNIKAMFMHKVGNVLVNSADSIIISAFVGIALLGRYSNYTTIIVALIGVLSLFFTPLTSIIGQMCASNDKITARKYFYFFYTFNYILGCIFFLGYFATIDNVVNIVFGDDLLLSKALSFTITLNYFIQFLRQSTLLFRDATGTFYNDRWKPLAEGLVNIILSIALVVLLPEEYKVVGVIVATIITNLFICHIVEPYVLFKYGFKESPKRFMTINYSLIVVFTVVLLSLSFFKFEIANNFYEFIINGLIAVTASLIPIAIAVLINADFRYYSKKMMNKVLRRHRAKQSAEK